MTALLSLAEYLAVLCAAGWVGWWSLRHDSTAQPVAPAGQAGWVHLGLVGDRTRAEPIRGLVRIAPQDDRKLALEVSTADGWPLVSIPLSQVRTARGWSDGRIFASFGEACRPFRASWPRRQDRPAWEMQVVDATGLAVRCYGAPEESPASDLDRLHARLHATAARSLR
jgi:hypothetical protein